MAGVIFPEQQRHQQPDADAEQQAEQDPGRGELRPQDAAGIGQRHDVAGRREEQEGDGRPDAGALAVDAGKQRHDGAGADRQQRAGSGGGRIGDMGRRAAPEPARDAGLRDQRRHRAGNEEGRQQAQQHMRGQIGRQAAGAAMEQFQHEIHLGPPRLSFSF
jgi:hypothetical protein